MAEVTGRHSFLFFRRPAILVEMPRLADVCRRMPRWVPRSRFWRRKSAVRTVIPTPPVPPPIRADSWGAEFPVVPGQTFLASLAMVDLTGFNYCFFCSFEFFWLGVYLIGNFNII